MERLPRIHKLDGKQGGTFTYYYSGHLYHHDKRGAGLIFRCKYKGAAGVECKASMSVDSLVNLENRIPQLNGIHDEPADHLYLLKRSFDEEVKLLSRTTFLPLRQIFDQVTSQER